ncbi:hypothetical protein [Carnobacterium inhibens]|uniref:Uncharacterized protein n=1 Tax=Carnobacterium inhibens subsp. gilichinskyi TaxID=1266845 RepID=U5SD94_9LACT|nr:hypothetical protein [Carnobacterium inhibens]AGY83026.1 hypothetical protein Q783_12125 [Carnobacterium inhibens subsp. gilichinskyi]
MSNHFKQLQQEINRVERSIQLDSQKERKERTRRLIQKGALLENYFECEHLSIEETEELLKVFSSYVNEKKHEKFKKNK